MFVDTPGMHKAVPALGQPAERRGAGERVDADVVCWWWTPPRRWAGATSSSPPGSTARRSWSSRRSTPRAPRRSLAQLDAAQRFDADRVLPGVGPDGRGRRCARRRHRRPAAGGPGLVPRRGRHRHARGGPGRRAGARAAVHADEGGAALLHRHHGGGVGGQVRAVRDPRGAAQPGGNGGRQEGQAHQGGGERRPPQLPEGTYLDLHVRVEKDWQRRPAVVDRLLDGSSADE